MFFLRIGLNIDQLMDQFILTDLDRKNNFTSYKIDGQIIDNISLQDIETSLLNSLAFIV